MKIFFDTNVILDVTERRIGESDVRAIMAYASQSQFSRIYGSFLSVADIAYIIRKKPISEIKQTIRSVHSWMEVLPCSDMDFIYAAKCEGPDYEDCLQIAVAERQGCDVIVTRNISHFRAYTDIPVLTPEEFVSHMAE